MPKTRVAVSRKKNERVMIGDSLVTVIRTSASRVRLLIEAEQDVRVARGEVLDRIEAEEATQVEVI